MDATFEERIAALESTAYRHGEQLARLDGAARRIDGKLDGLSQQAREVRSVLGELTDLVRILAARQDPAPE